MCSTCQVNSIRSWSDEKGYEDVAFFWEQGDAGQHEFRGMMERDHQRLSRQKPQFLCKSFEDGQGQIRYIRPFEVADLAAYEMRKAAPFIKHPKKEGVGIIDTSRIRGAARTWVNGRTTNGTFLLQHMMKVCEISKVPKRA